MVKRIIIVLLIGFTVLTSEAQISLGFRLNPGIGKMSSKSLSDYLNNLDEQDTTLSLLNSGSRFRMNMGVGGFAEYHFNEHVSLTGELTFNFFNSHILINQRTDYQFSPDTLFESRISSTASVGMKFIQIPILARYIFTKYKSYFVTGGVSFAYAFRPVIKSDEEFTNSIFDEGILVDYSTEKFSSRGKADGFKPFAMHAVIGIGKKINIWERYLSYEIRYSFPILRSPLYTNDQKFLENSLNNTVFTGIGKTLISGFNPQYSLEDFRYSQITLSVSYYLFHNKAAGTSLNPDAAPAGQGEE